MTMTQTGPKVIKKYANRKLYDTEASKYTTLKQIASEVTAGRDVQILDNVSQVDITAMTLLQALVETSDNATTTTLVDIFRSGGLTKYVAGVKTNELTSENTGV